jgi:spoIIIJ-associated protein
MEPFENDKSDPQSADPQDVASDVEDSSAQTDEDGYDDDETFDGEEEFDDEEGDEEDDEAYDDEEYDDDDAEEDEDDGAPGRAARPRDPRSDKAYEFLAKILDDMGMDVSVRRRRPRPDSSPDEIHLEIVGHDVGRVIGKKGQVLTALQYLVNRVANRPGLPRRHVVLDAEGYRYRRETTLATLAKRLGEQAVKEGKIITFEPMSPRDRRVVHLALAKFPNVVTKSDGEGEERRVRIIPVRR